MQVSVPVSLYHRRNSWYSRFVTLRSDFLNGVMLMMLWLLTSGLSQAQPTNCPTMSLPDLPNPTAGVFYQASVAASPAGQYTYYLEGNLPNGLALDAATGVLSGTLYDGGHTYQEFLIRAIDANGCYIEKEYTISVNDASCTFTSLPNQLVIGKDYAIQVKFIQNGNEIVPDDDFSYYIISDGTLPPGLEFEYDGILSGTPTQAGTYQFTISGSLYRSCDASRSYTIHVNGCPNIVLPDLPQPTKGVPYRASAAASPAGNYTYEVVEADDLEVFQYPGLPPGLSLNAATGEITGTFTGARPKFDYAFAIQATDANGCSTKRSYVWGINCGDVQLEAIGLPSQVYMALYYEFNVSVNALENGYASGVNGLSVSGLPPGLTYSSDPYSSTLSLSGTPYVAGTYTITIDATVDYYCGASRTYTLTVVPSCVGLGSILRETWVKAKGYDVRQIPVNTPPTATRQLTKFEGPSNVTNEYGDRIRGYICPPTSGEYTFWIASDDNSVLYLSSDDQPTHKRRIAWVNGATKPREWTKFASQQSEPIYLLAGQKYYIESLHKEAMGSDHLAVGWQLPDGTLERPIPGERLSPFLVPKDAHAREVSLEEHLDVAPIASLRAVPNPFAEQAVIRFTTPVSGKSTVAVYDLTGSLVNVLFEGELEAGQTKELTFDGNPLPSGIYLVKAVSSAEISHLKLVLTK